MQKLFNESFNKQAVENFCDYLKCETVHPNPDYSQAVKFLKLQSAKLNLEFSIFELYPNNPIVLIKWNGRNTSLKSVVLNSHMDVVPVFPEHWVYEPFSAHIDKNGNIFARGAQDMKCCGSQYLEAIRLIKIKSPEFIPERNIYVLFVPDEEVGGKKGMEMFVETEQFKEMNVGIVMDEGIPNPDNEYLAFYGDRVAWWIKVHINGSTGHGSQFIKDTAGVKLRLLLDKFMDFRDKEEARMIRDNLTLGDVTTVNLTGVTGGIQHNVIPTPFTMDLDIRITPHIDIVEFKSMIDGWAKECGEGIEYEYISHTPCAYLTVNDSSNKWWAAFESVCKSFNMDILSQIFPAGTDSRFIRMKGISAIGFSPINNTPVLLHDHNEYLNIDTFIKGIYFYEKLILQYSSLNE